MGSGDFMLQSMSVLSDLIDVEVVLVPEGQLQSP